MQSSALKRLCLETVLRSALSQGSHANRTSAIQGGASHPKAPQSEFQVDYQPIVSVKTLKVAGFEALVWWQHPEQGMIAPVEFIAIAEETGLIMPLGEPVMSDIATQILAAG